jgi:hypothetical protein
MSRIHPECSDADPLDRSVAANALLLNEHLSRLSPHHVQEFHQRAYEECRMIYTRVPNPKAIQSLIQARKLLWKWRR